jgi:hypothetical protein
VYAGVLLFVLSITIRTIFENRVLRRIFEPKTGEGTGGWRKLHNEELYNVYSSPNITRMIKPRKIRWAENVASEGPRFEKHYCSWPITRSNLYNWSLNQCASLVRIRGAVCLSGPEMLYLRAPTM